MSLQVTLKDVLDRLGKATTDARELGLQITNAELAGKDTEAKEAGEKFAKALKDVETFSKSKSRVESMIEDEKVARQVQNALPTEPELLDEGKRVELPKPEALASVKDRHREMQNCYFRHGEKDPRFLAARAKVIEATASLPAAERQALIGTIGSLGGALVTEDFKAEVVKNMAGIAVMRASGIRVVPCSSDTLVFPSILGGTDPWSTGFAGSWKPAGATGTDGSAPTVQNQPTFGNERIPVHEWQPDAVVVEPSLMEDSVVPLESIIAEAIAETRAMDEDYAFLRGTGIGQPRGIHDYIGSGITAVNSGSATTFTYNGLIDLMYTLPAQYRDASVWYCRSTAFGEILKLKDSSQMPIIYSGQVPGTLFGHKVWMTEHMPAVAGSVKALLFGNPRYYIVAERRDLRVQRLEERFAPNVGFLASSRLGGGLVRPVAFVAQNISA